MNVIKSALITSASGKFSLLLKYNERALTYRDVLYTGTTEVCSKKSHFNQPFAIIINLIFKKNYFFLTFRAFRTQLNFHTPIFKMMDVLIKQRERSPEVLNEDSYSIEPRKMTPSF